MFTEVLLMVAKSFYQPQLNESLNGSIQPDRKSFQQPNFYFVYLKKLKIFRQKKDYPFLGAYYEMGKSMQNNDLTNMKYL